MSDLHSVCREIGSSLKLIDIVFKNSSLQECTETLYEIRVHFKNLEDIRLRVGRCDNIVKNESAKFITSYGEQVHTALLNNAHPDICAGLLLRCPYIFITYVALELRFDSVVPLGDRISSLSLDLERAMESSRCLISLDVCVHLFKPLPIDSLKASFATPLYCLRNLTLPTIEDVESTTKLISKQAPYLGSL